MLIAQISDTHILAKSSDRPEAPSRADDLRRCIADINSLDPLPEIVIHTGDTVQTGSREDYDQLTDLLALLKLPIFLAPGNRDDRDNFRTAFGPANGDYPFLHQVVEDYHIRLVGLDTTEPEQRKGAFCADRLRWLDETLAAAPDRPTILFMHHPPFDVGPRYIDGYSNPADRTALRSVIDSHPQIRRLVCGHCHRSSARSWAGTEATTMASVACDVREGIDAERFATTPMYQLHAISDDGTVATQTRFAPD